MFNPLLLSPNSNSYANPIESVPSERYQTKTKAMTSSNQNTGKYLKEPIRTQSKNNLPAEAREKASDQVVIDFNFEWNRLRGWRKFFWTSHRLKKRKTKAVLGRKFLKNLWYCVVGGV